MVIPTNNIAFTAPVNPDGAIPVLKLEQVWAGLLIKIRSAETFVPAIQSTTVISETTDPTTGNQVTVREVVFREDQRKVRETVTAFAHSRVVFAEPDGSYISNVISEGADGELYMTYVFEWRHPGASETEMVGYLEKDKSISRMALEETIKNMRVLAHDGKILEPDITTGILVIAM